MPTTQEPTLSDYERERGKPRPSQNHGLVQQFIGVQLGAYYPTYVSMQELTLRIDDAGDLTPDISVFPTIHFDYGEDRTRVTEPPLIAVEIASPTQSTQELVTKCRRYVRAGVASVWLVQPALQTVTVFHDDDPANTYNRDETLVDPATDIKIDLAEVFRPPPDASEAKPEG